jgi:hypothetical protein
MTRGVDAFLLEACVELARAKGLDTERAWTHMAYAIAQMNLPKEVFRKTERIQLKIWSRMYVN